MFWQQLVQKFTQQFKNKYYFGPLTCIFRTFHTGMEPHLCRRNVHSWSKHMQTYFSHICDTSHCFHQPATMIVLQTLDWNSTEAQSYTITMQVKTDGTIRTSIPLAIVYLITLREFPIYKHNRHLNKKSTILMSPVKRFWLFLMLHLFQDLFETWHSSDETVPITDCKKQSFSFKLVF